MIVFERTHCFYINSIIKLWITAVVIIKYTKTDDFTCTYDVTLIKDVIRVTDSPLRQSQKQRESKCLVENNNDDLYVYKCDSNFNQAIKVDCLLCGIELKPGSELKPLCSSGKDNPNRILTCEECKKQNVCLNNGTGTCPESWRPYAKDFKCICPPGFTGKWCENKIQETKTLLCNCSPNIKSQINAYCNESQLLPCYAGIMNIGCLCNVSTNKHRNQRKCSEIKKEISRSLGGGKGQFDMPLTSEQGLDAHMNHRWTYNDTTPLMYTNWAPQPDNGYVPTTCTLISLMVIMCI